MTAPTASAARVHPAQPWEAREIAVGGIEREAVLQRQGREIGVRHEIRLDARQGEQLAEELGMMVTRLRDPDDITGKPGSHLLPRACNGFWLFEDARVRDEPQERQQAGPGQASWSVAVQLAVQPLWSLENRRSIWSMVKVAGLALPGQVGFAWQRGRNRGPPPCKYNEKSGVGSSSYTRRF